MAKLTGDVMQWMDKELARDAALRQAVERRMAELALEEELVALRERQGLTQAQAARLIGVSQPAIAKLESGRVKNLELKTLLRVVTALGGELQIAIKKPRRVARVIGIRAAKV